MIESHDLHDFSDDEKIEQMPIESVETADSVEIPDVQETPNPQSLQEETSSAISPELPPENKDHDSDENPSTPPQSQVNLPNHPIHVQSHAKHTSTTLQSQKNKENYEPEMSKERILHRN